MYCKKKEQPTLLKPMVHSTYMYEKSSCLCRAVLCTLRMKEAGTLLYNMIRGAYALHEGSRPLCYNLYDSGAYLMYEMSCGAPAPPPGPRAERRRRG